MNESADACIPPVGASFKPVKFGPSDVEHDEWVGKVGSYASDVEEDDWVQARDFWNMLKDEGDDELFIGNLTGHLSKALPEVQKETVSKWSAVLALFVGE
jgi:catalase